MYLILVVGLILVGLAGALSVRALGFRNVPAAQRLRLIDMYGFRGDKPESPEPRRKGLDISVLAERTGTVLVGRIGGVDAARMRRELLGAGYYNLTPEAYLGYRFIATAAFTLFLATLAILS